MRFETVNNHLGGGRISWHDQLSRPHAAQSSLDRGNEQRQFDVEPAVPRAETRFLQIGILEHPQTQQQLAGNRKRRTLRLANRIQGRLPETLRSPRDGVFP